MFSDTAITDRHSDTTNFQLRAHWVRISWSVGSEKSFGHVPPVGVELPIHNNAEVTAVAVIYLRCGTAGHRKTNQNVYRSFSRYCIVN